MSKHPAVTKAAILSLSLVVMTSNAVSVLMGDMQVDYPHIATAKLQSFVTISALSVMVCILLSGVLAGRLPVRKILLPGLVIYTLGGLMPIVVYEFNHLLLSRLLLGVGLGLINPLSVSLIADFYQGDERTQVMGMQFSVGNIGQSVLLFLAGVLTVFGWRRSFWIYALGIPVFLFVFLFLPEPPVRDEGEPVSAAKQQYHLTPKAWGIAVLTGIYNLLFFTVFSNLALVVTGEDIGTAAVVGTAMTVMTLVSMLVAAFFGQFYRLFCRNLGALASLLVCAAFFLLSIAANMATITAALIILGFGNALIMPYAYTSISLASPPQTVTFSLAVLQALANLGIFVCPYVFAGFGELFGNPSGRFSFRLCTLAMLAGALLLYLLVRLPAPAKERE